MKPGGILRVVLQEVFQLGPLALLEERQHLHVLLQTVQDLFALTGQAEQRPFRQVFAPGVRVGKQVRQHQDPQKDRGIKKRIGAVPRGTLAQGRPEAAQVEDQAEKHQEAAGNQVRHRVEGQIPGEQQGHDAEQQQDNSAQTGNLTDFFHESYLHLIDSTDRLVMKSENRIKERK